MPSAGRKLTGRRPMLCLPARQSRLGLRKRSCVTRRGHLQVASMAQRQPNGEGERNGLVREPPLKSRQGSGSPERSPRPKPRRIRDAKNRSPRSSGVAGRSLIHGD